MLRNGGVFAPVDRLSRLRDDVDRIFDGLWPESGSETVGWIPPMDVHETEDDLRCVLEVPGMSTEDLDITVDRNVLTISGEKRFEQSENSRVFRSERRYGRFSRSVTLPSGVDADAVRAEYTDGVLTVVLPKTAESKPRRIAIQPGDSARRLTEGNKGS